MFRGCVDILRSICVTMAFGFLTASSGSVCDYTDVFLQAAEFVLRYVALRV